MSFPPIAFLLLRSFWFDDTHAKCAFEEGGAVLFPRTPLENQESLI